MWNHPVSLMEVPHLHKSKMATVAQYWEHIISQIWPLVKCNISIIWFLGPRNLFLVVLLLFKLILTMRICINPIWPPPEIDNLILHSKNNHGDSFLWHEYGIKHYTSCMIWNHPVSLMEVPHLHKSKMATTRNSKFYITLKLLSGL